MFLHDQWNIATDDSFNTAVASVWNALAGVIEMDRFTIFVYGYIALQGVWAFAFMLAMIRAGMKDTSRGAEFARWIRWRLPLFVLFLGLNSLTFGLILPHIH